MDHVESPAPTSFLGGLGGFAQAGASMMAGGMAGGPGAMLGMPPTPAGVPPGMSPFPGPAELIPSPMPDAGSAEPAQVATNQLGVGVAASAVIGVLLGCLLFRRGDQAADGDSDEDLQSSDNSK